MEGSRNLRKFRWWGAPVTLTATHENDDAGRQPSPGTIGSGAQASRFVKEYLSNQLYTNTKNGYGGRDRLLQCAPHLEPETPASSPCPLCRSGGRALARPHPLDPISPALLSPPIGSSAPS